MKKRIKQVVCIVVLFCLSLIVSVPVFASETSDTQIPNTNPTESIIITDADELEQIVEDEKLEVPDGYVLEKVEIDVYNFDSEECDETEIEEENIVEPLGILYTIKNVVNVGECASSNCDSSDWYYGPATVSEKYSYTKA